VTTRHRNKKASEPHPAGQGRSRFWRYGAALAPLAAILLWALHGAAARSDDAKMQVPAEDLRPLVVLDPGHGGTNSGAPSVRPNIFEKHLTLALAGELRRELVQRGFRVELTRVRDEYLTLRQRGRMANQLDADLFVSIHANATESHSHSGYETFILTPEAVDVDSRALRLDSGRVRGDLDRDTALLLDDVERSTSQERAAQVAASIQRQMRRVRGEVGDRGVRQDSMHVLLGATMPAVLVEVGFIDHPIEGEEILDPELRAGIVTALADAIAEHRDALR
jgi:N-acetylmuramoyl-L-alanine amidase